jgi:ABC-2 type transport system permease protein
MNATVPAPTSTDPSPTGVRRDAGFVPSAVLCAGRFWTVLTRSPVAIVQSVVFSMLLLLTILAAFGRTVGGSVEAYADRLVPQLVISSGAFGAIGTALQVHLDRTTGMVDRLRSLPIARASYLAGAVLADAIRAAAAATTLVLVGHLVGFRFDQGVLAAIGFFAFAVAFGSIFAWFAVWAGMRVEQPEAIGSLMNAPVLMLFFLSTGFVPVEGFPAAAQPVVRVNPLSCAVNLMLGLSESGPVLVPLLQCLAWIVGLGGLFAVLAVRTFRAR